MKKMTPVCIALSADDMKLLGRLAARAGSRSAAVRQLIERERQEDRRGEIEEQYRAYYSDPKVQKQKQEWTRDMMAASSWFWKGGGERGRKRSASR